MQETDIFGVQNPETGEIGFVSTMGRGGEHYAVSVTGAPKVSLASMLCNSKLPLRRKRFSRFPNSKPPLRTVTSLKKADRDMIKELGLKYRGQQAWPLTP